MSLTVSLSMRGTILFYNLLYFFLFYSSWSYKFWRTSRYLPYTLSRYIYAYYNFLFKLFISFFASSNSTFCLLIIWAWVCKSPNSICNYFSSNLYLYFVWLIYHSFYRFNESVFTIKACSSVIKIITKFNFLNTISITE